MAIIRWDPFQDVSALQDRINRLFDDAFPRNDCRDDDMSLCVWRPPVDIYETDGTLILKAELPGVSKADVTVEVKDNILTLKGERADDPNIHQDSYLRRERSFGAFSRSFNLQHNINPEMIRAKFKDGVLEVIIPKPEEERPNQITVNVE